MKTIPLSLQTFHPETVGNGNIRSLPGPDDITRVVLPNGITVLSRSNFNSPSVVISGYLPVGSRQDPVEKLGLAHFTSLALMRGSQRRSFQQIFDILESAGASLGFGASVHNTSFGGRALVEDLPMLLELLAETLHQPSFPTDQMERLRGQLLTGLAIRSQDTGDTASLNFDKILFGDHPYGRPEDGYTETVKAIQVEDLIHFHSTNFTPAGLVVVVVGAIDPQSAVEQVQKTFGNWISREDPASLPPLPELHLPQASIREHKAIPGKSQTDLIIGSLGPRRRSDDYLPASLGNSILGQFGMMGRIGDVVREQSGLAYHASTSLNAWIEGGSWEVSAGVNPANLDKAIDLIIQELSRFVRDTVTTEEIDDSKANFIGRLPLSFESNSGVANALLNLERFQLDLDYYRNYSSLVSQITPEQILDVARKYIDPEKLVVSSAGSPL
ncbi:MAG: M16 family metallopeptidase [Anaerolineaceae bacterium]